MKNKPMKILFDANPLAKSKSGVGYHVDGLMRALSRVGGEDIELVGHYFNFLGKKRFSDLPTGKNISYTQSKILPGKFLSLCRKFGFQPPFELFTKTHGDILLCTNFAVYPSLFRSKKVVIMYDLGYLDCPEHVAIKNLNFLKIWAPRAIMQADKIVVNTIFTKNRIIDEYKIAKDKFCIMPIPPVTNPDIKSESLRRFNIPSKFLLFVGTIEPRKGIDTLLDAYKQLPKNIQSEYSLVLAGGKGWNDEEILQKITNLKHAGLSIILTGYVSDGEKASLYKKSVFCIQPSIYEGFGMPILEAMTYGKAVICSDIDVFHEVAGTSAVYFKTNDPRALSDAIRKLLHDPKKLRATEKAGTTHLKNLASWDEVAVDFIKELKTVLR
jgi:glycosyltransferase involved in cell wall biosynthesis